MSADRVGIGLSVLEFFNFTPPPPENRTLAKRSRAQTQQILGIKDDYGYTCLHYAARGGHAALIKAIVNAVGRGGG